MLQIKGFQKVYQQITSPWPAMVEDGCIGLSVYVSICVCVSACHLHISVRICFLHLEWMDGDI